MRKLITTSDSGMQTPAPSSGTRRLVSPSTQAAPASQPFLESTLGRLLTGGAPVAEAVKFSPTIKRVGEEAMGAVQKATSGDLSIPAQQYKPEDYQATQLMKMLGPLGSVISGITGKSQEEQKNLPAYGEIAGEFVGANAPKIISKGVKAVSNILPEKALGRAVGKAAEAATKRGAMVSSTDPRFAKAIEMARKAAKRTLSEIPEEAGPISNINKMTPKVVHKLKIALEKSAPNVWESLGKGQAGKVEKEAIKNAVRVINKALYEAAPELQRASETFSTYKKAKDFAVKSGMVLTALKSLGLGPKAIEMITGQMK